MLGRAASRGVPRARAMDVRHPGRRIVSVCALLIVLLVGAACQPAPAPPKSVAKNVSLLHYFSFSGAFSGGMDQQASAFNQGSTAHHLSAVPVDHESFKTSILEDLRLGNSADLYSYWAGARVQAILEHLAPIDEALPLGELSRDFSPAVIQSAAMYNGRVYFLPLTQHYVGFFYNKKVFTQYGLSPPKTWQAFLQVVETLRRKGVDPVALGAKAKWPAQFWFDYLLLRTAPLDYRERLLAGRAAFTDPEVQRAFGLWRDLLRAGAFNARPNDLDFDTGAAAMVFRGEAAMTLMGTWLIGYYAGSEFNWQEDSDFGFFPFPVIDPRIPRVALGPIDGLVMPRAAKNSAGAKAVLRHFASASAQESLSRATGALAPSRNVPDSAYSPLKQAVRAEINTCEGWAFNFDLAAPPLIAETGLNLFAQFLEFPDQYPRLLDKAEARIRQRAVP